MATGLEYDAAQASVEQWREPGQGHVDGYGPGGWSGTYFQLSVNSHLPLDFLWFEMMQTDTLGGFTLAATTYLDDVQPGGGCFW